MGMKYKNDTLCLDKLDIGAQYEHIENKEWISVTTDVDGRLLDGIKRNGSRYIPELDSINQDIQTLNSNKADKNELETHFYRFNTFNKVICVGDSATQGMVTEGTEENPATITRVIPEASYPTKLGRMFPYLDITNKALSGITPTGWYDTYYADTDFSQYDLMFFLLGANGWLYYDDLNVPGTNTYNYRRIVSGARAQNPDATMVLMRYSGAGGDFIPILEYMAEESDCIIVDLWDTTYLDLSNSIYHGWYEEDGVAKYDKTHFTRKGYNAMAYVIARLLANKLSDATKY